MRDPALLCGFIKSDGSGCQNFKTKGADGKKLDHCHLASHQPGYVKPPSVPKPKAKNNTLGKAPADGPWARTRAACTANPDWSTDDLEAIPMLSPQAQAKADANAAAVAARKAVKARNGQAGEKGKGVKDQAGVGGKSTTKAEANAAATAAREAANSKKDQAGSKVNATAKVSDSIAGPASGTEPLESAETGGTPPKKATTKPLPAVLVPGSHRQAQNKRILSAGREKSNVDTNISETVDFVLSETFLENKSPGGSRSVQARGGAYPYIPRILSENATGSSSNTVATGIADTATAETPTPPTTAAKDQALAIRAARHRSATSAPRSLEATLRNSFPSSRAISVSSSHTSSTEDFSDINVEGDQIDRMFNDLEADMERMEKETEKGKGKKVDKEIHKGYYKGKGKEKEK